MSNIVISIENLSKQYRLGEIGTGTISHDLKRWWASIRGKEDPFSLVGQVNDRSQKAVSDLVWALKDINFEVKQGEVMGIIGKNGAGKSTLLKLISRITSPTTGAIKIKGRIASLLEVGTGMHPEMTARENIYLNGAIMGMTKSEITQKFDEIVDFSGCAMYVDTPVKRYSSGMRVRLGFAVAAFLEPEILIVDEVLAVGDAEFQKKAIGKMKDVSSSEGRTVLFVSHNMAAVKSLCTQGVVLKNGMIVFEGDSNTCVQKYMTNHSKMTNHRIWEVGEINHADFDLMEAYIKGKEKKMEETVAIDEALELTMTLKNKTTNHRIDVSLVFKDKEGGKLFAAGSGVISEVNNTGEITYKCNIPANFFNNGTFYIDLYVVMDRRVSIYVEPDFLEFTLVNRAMELGQYMGEEPGALRPLFDWSVLGK